MPSSISDLSSDGGISINPRLTSLSQAKYTTGKGFTNALVSCFQNSVPISRPQILQMTVTFGDIRAACQSAQSRIMRLQQATNTQVGLTSTIREGWFDELRHVAQCFITAQQASAKIEQAINTERAQLQGALSAALNERDVTKSELDSARQEIRFLRSRVDELMSKASTQHHVDSSWTNSTYGKSIARSVPESQVETSSWLSRSSSQDSPSDVSLNDSSVDLLQQLPTKVEDMPFTPERKPTSLPYKHDGNAYRSDTPGDCQPFRSSADQIYSQSDQLKLFVREYGPLVQRTQYNGIIAKTPDFSGSFAERHRNNSSTNGHKAAGRFNRTPFSSQGPFAPPPSQHQPGNAFRSQHETRVRASTPTQGSNMGMQSAIPPRQNQRELHQKPYPQLQQRQAYPGPDTPGLLEQGLVPAPSMELALVQSRYEPFNEYAPGVAPLNTSDEERIRDIFHFFNKMTDWVTRYCSVPNKKLINDMERLFPRLWDYACSATYPNNTSNAASHSMFMLSSDEFRKYFLTRLLIQYVVQQMWNAQAWEGLDDELTEVLMSVKHRLDPKYGYDAILQPHERHALVEKRSRAIYDFMRQPSWSKIKSQKMNVALTRFKDIVGPMMNREDIDRQAALHELSGISEGALRLSAILNTSRLSFQFIFNECGIKFSDQSHRPLNASLPTRELQAHHWRLMCVVTPGITYRNDAGVSMDPRFLAKANVLLMQ